MEEDDYDCRTPIGKVIKQINYLCKKPPFDNQLSEAIDVFHEKLEEQEKYLVNGIFKINFAESALFIQSCAELYGKKIDLLWNELLEFHTRLIKYDCEHQKEKGIPINKDVVAKLEERRNRYLRKKNFRLLQEEQEVAPPKVLIQEVNLDYLIKEDKKFFETEKLCRAEEDDKSVQLWRDIESETKEHLKVPYPVYQLMRKTYRLKNYPILQSQDFDILDMEDGEFNTKYSRVPGWHHILHLIEYNEEGLLPDTNNLIANLKLGVRDKFKFLLSRKIPFSMPFEQYKNEYMEYRKQFLKEEAKKWQNMPLNTFEDFGKQLQALTRLLEETEKLKNGKRSITDKIDILDSSDADSVLSCEPLQNCEKEFKKPDLFVRLEKLSCDVINKKLRQDSGYFDCNSFSDSENVQITKDGTETTMLEGNTSSDASKSDATGESNETGEKEVKADALIDLNSNYANGIESTEEEDKENDDDSDARSCISDHSYCKMPPITEIASVKGDEGQVKNEEVSKDAEIFKKPLGRAKVIPKNDKQPRKTHQLNRDLEDGESPPKRRKLSQKQIHALLQGKITPVKLLKFEKFFSENYEAGEGEGKVPAIEYDSDDSDTDNIDSDIPTGDNDNTEDRDDVRSIHSDHSYCRTLSKDFQNDSGFDEPSSQSVHNDNANGEPLSIEEECRRLEAMYPAEDLLDNIPIRPTLPAAPSELDPTEKESMESRARVEEWRNTINPILKNLREHDFDIHEYGSRIMDGMEINESRPFGDIVRGETSAEVVRYFISSLQLANTNNIEICGAKQGQLSNDTYTVKLLSKDRFHEHLKDYLAPSEETLTEKLEKVRAMKSHQEKLGVRKTKHFKKIISNETKLPHDDAKHKLVVNVTKLSLNKSPSQRKPMEATHQQNKENYSTVQRSSPNNTVKGKSIMKRQVTTPHILNFDISSPSTSRQSYWVDAPSRSCEPSTSLQNSELSVDAHEGHPKVYGASPNKRRHSDSTEESFIERLVAAQSVNPDIQWR